MPESKSGAKGRVLVRAEAMMIVEGRSCEKDLRLLDPETRGGITDEGIREFKLGGEGGGRERQK